MGRNLGTRLLTSPFQMIPCQWQVFEWMAASYHSILASLAVLMHVYIYVHWVVSLLAFNCNLLCCNDKPAYSHSPCSSSYSLLCKQTFALPPEGFSLLPGKGPILYMHIQGMACIFKVWPTYSRCGLKVSTTPIPRYESEGKYKVLSLHLFTLQLGLECIKDAGRGLCMFTFTFISWLPCLHTFWRAIPTSYYMFFLL